MGAKFCCSEYEVTEAGDALVLRKTEPDPQAALPFDMTMADAPLCSACAGLMTRSSKHGNGSPAAQAKEHNRCNNSVPPRRQWSLPGRPVSRLGEALAVGRWNPGVDQAVRDHLRSAPRAAQSAVL